MFLEMRVSVVNIVYSGSESQHPHVTTGILSSYVTVPIRNFPIGQNLSSCHESSMRMYLALASDGNSTLNLVFILVLINLVK